MDKGHVSRVFSKSLSKTNLRGFLVQNIVPIMFVIFCLVAVRWSGKPLAFLLQEVVFRMSRNSFLVLSLVIPVMAGLGLNFGLVIGAMAGQAGLIFVASKQVPGVLGLLTACLVALPLALGLGYIIGRIMNMARGREMIAGMILGFFMNGVYQLVFLFGIGTVIPFSNKNMMLPSGIGLRNTVELTSVKWVLDELLMVRIGPVRVPLATLALSAVLGVLIIGLYRTKLGQDIRAIGQDMKVSQVAGIQVDRTRIVAMMISTVLGAFGQIIFLQNIGTLNVYDSHGQIATFAIAAILVGGATVSRATVGQAFLGTFLFHLLFIVSPYAGQNLLGSAQVGEYFRVFAAYAIIAVSLALHSMQRARSGAASKR
jgi:simple sugar transport system permease protein